MMQKGTQSIGITNLQRTHCLKKREEVINHKIAWLQFCSWF